MTKKQKLGLAMNIMGLLLITPGLAMFICGHVPDPDVARIALIVLCSLSWVNCLNGVLLYYLKRKLEKLQAKLQEQQLQAQEYDVTTEHSAPEKNDEVKGATEN